MSDGDHCSPWRKSSFSGNGDCLEWSVTAEGVRLRDSRSHDELRLTHTEWAAFVAGVKAGEADLEL